MAGSSSFVKGCLVGAAACLLSVSLAGIGQAATLTTLGDKGVRLTVAPGRYSIEETERAGEDFRRVRVFGAGRTEDAGRPDLPVYGYWVAVPPGHLARARVVEADFEDLPGAPVEPVFRDTVVAGNALLLFAMDRAFYRGAAWYPDPVVTVGEVARFRHQDVAPVRVSPFQFQPSTGLLRVYRRLVIDVEFAPDPMKRGAIPLEPVGGEGEWEGVYRGAIVNYEQARSFRARSERPPPVPAKTFVSRDEYKIAVEESGLFRIDFSALRDAGLAPGTPIGSLELLRRGFSDEALGSGGDPFTEVSMPFHIVDTGRDGLFGEGDALVAYLPGFRQDRMERDTDDRYASEAVYFLTVEGTREPLVERDGWRGYPGLAPLVSYPDSIRWEVDAFYNVEANFDTTDLYFAASSEQTSRLTEITLPPVDPAVPFGVKAMTVSLEDNQKRYHRYVLTNQAGGDTVLNAVVLGTAPRLFPAERTHPASSLAAGVNRFAYEGWRGATPAANDIEGARGFLDWYEIHANFLYRAVEDHALFSSGGSAGRFQIEVSGFSSPDILLFDVSDPHRGARILADSVRAEAGGYTLVFQDSSDVSKRYAASTFGAAPRVSSSAVRADEPVDLASAEGDYLIIPWDGFAEEMEPLAAHRTAEGHRVLVAKASDVYDTFNGGVKDPRAIARYIAYAFRRWSSPPLAVLLVGDAYEDAKGIASNASYGDVDLIPTWPVFQKTAFLEVSGDHWDASDYTYVLLDGARDPLPDILIGRFPAGSEEEVARMVSKTIAYETFGPEDAWRGRAVFLADDAWVADQECLMDRGQVQFESNSAEFARELKETAARGIDTLNIFMSRFTDVYHDLSPCASDPDATNKADIDRTIELSREGIAGALFSEINGTGVGLVNFQGHGNRNVLTHEVILRNGISYRPNSGNTSQDIREKSDNAGRPYIFMGYGCSISEFDRFSSVGYDCLLEEMMMSDRGGSVATFGSTGTEELGRNLELNASVLRYMFETPGVVPGADADTLPAWYAGVPRWTLGEILSLGLMDFAATGSSDRYKVIRRYVLFGDPLLAVDARPPQFEVTVDGAKVEDGGPLLGRADGAPVAIVARVHDEVRIERSSLAVLESGEPLDTTLYTITPDDSLPNDGRSWKIAYSTDVRFGEYSIVFRATDGAGRTGTFTLKVFVDVALTFDGASIRDGDFVSREPLVRAEITTPVPVGAEEIRFELDGASLAPDTLRALDPLRWAAAFRPSLAPGDHALLVAVRALEKTVRFRVEDRFRVVDLMTYPNPTEAGTGFYYTLTDAADAVRAEVYTVTGKRIRIVEGLSGRVGYNANPDVWDGADRDGDRVANGVYLYRVIAEKSGARTEAVGKAVIAR